MHAVRNEYIGVIVAVPEEARILRSMLSNWTSGLLVGRPSALAYWGAIPIAVVVSGQGEEQALLACRAMYEQYHPRLFISTGFCGALQSEVRVGDIVTSARIVREIDVLEAKVQGDTSGQHLPSRAPAAVLWQLIKQVNRDYQNLQVEQMRRPAAMSRCWEDTSITSSRVLGTAQDKVALGQLAGAVSVDMESATIAEFAAVAGVPWLTVRVVSDAATDDLPLDFARFTDAQGNTQYGDIVREVLRKPSLLPGLLRFGWNCQKASNSLRIYLQCLFTAIADYVEAQK